MAPRSCLPPYLLLAIGMSSACAGAGQKRPDPSTDHALAGTAPDVDAAARMPSGRADGGASPRERVEALFARWAESDRMRLIEEIRSSTDGNAGLLELAADSTAPAAPLAAELIGEIQSPEGFELLSSIVGRPNRLPTTEDAEGEHGPTSSADRPLPEGPSPAEPPRAWTRAALLGLSRFDTTSTAFVLMRAFAETSTAAQAAEPSTIAERQALIDYFWRMGLTGDLGVCAGTSPGKIAIADRAKGLGTPHPTLVVAADRSKRWAVIRQARADSNGDGRIEFSRSEDGGLRGDRTQLYLVLGSGEGEPIDDYFGQGAMGRYLAVRKGPCLALVDVAQRHETIVPGADLRSVRAAAAPASSATASSVTAPASSVTSAASSPPLAAGATIPRSAVFSNDGQLLLYPRPHNGLPRVVVRSLEKGVEASIDPGEGALLGIGFDSPNRHVLLYVRPASRGSRADLSWTGSSPTMRIASWTGGPAADAPYRDPSPSLPEDLGGLLLSATRAEASLGVVSGPLRWGAAKR